LTLIKPLDFGRGSADSEREAHSLSVSFVDRRTEPAERPLPAVGLQDVPPPRRLRPVAGARHAAFMRLLSAAGAWFGAMPSLSSRPAQVVELQLRADLELGGVLADLARKPGRLARFHPSARFGFRIRRRDIGALSMIASAAVNGMLTMRRRRLFGRRMIARLPSGAFLISLRSSFDEVADAQAGLPREPHRVGVRLGAF
jgi:hypothetical protein